MKVQLVLFGAGKGAAWYTQRLFDTQPTGNSLVLLLRKYGCEVTYYVDNDVRKHGTTFMGKPVRSPDALLTDTEPLILVAVGPDYANAILAQLHEMGLDERVLTSGRLVVAVMAKRLAAKPRVNVKAPYAYNVLFDAFCEIPWGGGEVFTLKLNRGLRRRGVGSFVLANGLLSVPPEYADGVLRLESDAPDCIDAILDAMLARLPFVYLHQQYGRGLLLLHAARALQQRYGDAVKTVFVMHGDTEEMYKLAHESGQEYHIDRWLATAPRVGRNLLDRYPDMDAERVYAHLNFTEYEADLRRAYSVDGEPLRLCWVARMTRYAKRADLLPTMIAKLTARLGCGFTLDIAGDGECRESVAAYVRDTGLGERVRVLGYVANDDLPQIHRRADVYLSFSETEASSLSMLEAMANGCVPVVTAVSGAESIVADGVNGYVCPVGDLDGLVARIAHLSERRDLLPLMGQRTREVIRDKCTLEGYVDFMQRELLHFGGEVAPCRR